MSRTFLNDREKERKKERRSFRKFKKEFSNTFYTSNDNVRTIL
jgi:hypothetical protein